MNKNIAILKMPHGIYRTDLPAEAQQAMTAMGVEDMPSVMPGSQPVDGECLAQVLVNDDVPATALGEISLAGVDLVGYYTGDFAPIVAMDAAVYDRFLSPIITLDEEGNVVGEVPQESLKITSIFAGQEVPEGGVWPNAVQ